MRGIDVVILGENAPNGNKEKSSEKSSEKILRLIKDNSEISAEERADVIGISSRAIEKNIAKLKQKGIIKRIGPDKGVGK
ncbi:hypothetical protein A2Y83_02415 [Candidatus Falkowbacteria bacterium RBG_13_39_14]|uniref:Uncharacterized protein n=1 Tax=Candidatus Falkowbacteria bacterium RBG_13_39_14 TaxID=1797985 RepID=A0A1F5SAV0_9BACT|nr:MAG: hypothetical protein A2Y83_02415 [Candidatus Falkowbacteria bacterium RBG_13_39_14]